MKLYTFMPISDTTLAYPYIYIDIDKEGADCTDS